jgi:glutamate 5-kinase
MLLTWDDFDNRKRFLNARATLKHLLSMNIIAVINENDAVSCDEIKFGDNDRLSALVADLVNADLAVILSDVKGLLDENKLVPCVEKVNAAVFNLVKQKKGTFTAGGMHTKLEAASIANAAGTNLVIASGREKNIISRLAAGESVGTIFLAADTVEHARKRWIAYSKKTKGKIVIDDGAKEALLNKGKSLLAVGILTIEGEFKEKDAIEIYDVESRLIGCGLITYSSDDLKNLRVKKFDKAIIHRDNFARKT